MGYHLLRTSFLTGFGDIDLQSVSVDLCWAYMEIAVRAGVQCAAEQRTVIRWNLMQLCKAQAAVARFGVIVEGEVDLINGDRIYRGDDVVAKDGSFVREKKGHYFIKSFVQLDLMAGIVQLNQVDQFIADLKV